MARRGGYGCRRGSVLCRAACNARQFGAGSTAGDVLGKAAIAYRCHKRMYRNQVGWDRAGKKHRSLARHRGREDEGNIPSKAQSFGIDWHGRRYDRANPDAAGLPNKAINHAASAVEGAAAIAVTATATIPQLGFIHEDSGQSFILDIADLYRDKITLKVAFRAVKEAPTSKTDNLERLMQSARRKRFIRNR